MKLLATQAGILRVLDTGGHKHSLLIVPDGPCVIEHYADLIDLLSSDFRVVCFDLPGFGFSYPTLKYDFSVSQTAEVVIGVRNDLGKDLPNATAKERQHIAYLTGILNKNGK